MSEKQYHVASMISHEQLVLKLLLKNMVKQKTKEIMHKLAGEKEPIKIELRYIDFTKIFNSFDDLSGSLPGYIGIEKVKTKLFYFSKHGLSFMMEAINLYDENKTEGFDSEDFQIIEEYFPQIKSLLDEANKYTYSADEISKAIKQG